MGWFKSNKGLCSLFNGSSNLTPYTVSSEPVNTGSSTGVESDAENIGITVTDTAYCNINENKAAFTGEITGTHLQDKCISGELPLKFSEEFKEESPKLTCEKALSGILYKVKADENPLTELLKFYISFKRKKRRIQ